ncbi:MAG: carbon-nitrogen hydrolase family protein [Gemmataceae bacterium]|nr:carbon-nitrogen hydrolase family protein [Gemmataceae bacterium]
MRRSALLHGLPIWAALAGGLLAALTLPARAQEPVPPTKLTVGIVQLALERDLTGNRDKMLRFLGQAKAKGCRVVVFPETALYAPRETARAEIDAALANLRKAADAHDVYVIFCVKYKRNDTERSFERLLVLDPDGRILHSYDKLWADARFNNVPGLFAIDGILCSATICADRWIRGVEELPAMKGSQILFECSNNYANEWIEDLGWYWYVPRALRNQAYVVFANTAKENRGEGKLGHGHSAVIAPDGSLVASAGEESDRLLVATLDLAQATRARALERRDHPLFRPFWETGIRILDGASVAVPAVASQTAPTVRLTIAAAQMACSRDVSANVARMKLLIQAAKVKAADVVVFPELAVTGALEADIMAAEAATLQAALAEIQAAARTQSMYVAFGMPFHDGGKRYNGAFVVSAEGTLLTRYAQLVVDRPSSFAPGTSTKSLWFEIKGVPAVVTIGRDALWSEIAELAAVRGAQVHLHLGYDRDTSAAGTLRRRQLWVNLASYRTFTATVNAASPAGLPQPSATANGGSVLWEDFHRAASGPAGGYAPHSAVRLAEAGMEEEILSATQEIPKTNPHLERVTGKTNPQMKPWYLAGARALATDRPAAQPGEASRSRPPPQR